MKHIHDKQFCLMFGLAESVIYIFIENIFGYIQI